MHDSVMKKILLFLLFTTAAAQACAVNRSFYFEHLKVEDGLTQNTVTAILQDSKGFMWFGTKDGLNRYDGYKFKTFRNDPSDSTSLGNNFVHSLYEDKEGSLWVGTDTGLYIYDPKMETFRRFNLRTADGTGIDKEVHCIVPDRLGNIWLGVYWSGLFRYDTNTHEISKISYIDGSTRGLRSNGIWDICVDVDNIVWIGTVGGGLNMYNPANGTIRFFSIPHTGKRDDVVVVKEEGPNALLLGTTDDGVWRFDKVTLSYTPYINDGAGTMYLRAIMKADNDRMWLGTESGLYLYDTSTGKLQNARLDFSNNYSLSSNAVYSLCKDREGGIWAGTYFGGVNYLPPDHNYFEKYFPTNSHNSLSGNAVREFQEDGKGNFWIGTEDNGLNYFNPHTGEFTAYTPANSDLSYHNIHGLMLDGDKLFVGYFMRGLDVVDLKTFRVRNYSVNASPGSIGDNNVFAIEKDRSGTYWIGTVAGLNKFDPRTETFSRVHEPGTYAFIYDIMEDSRGLIWIATYYTGLFTYNPRSKEWRHFENIPGDPSSLGFNKTISLTEDSKGNIWIATEGGGVSVYDASSDRFRTYTVLDGLPNNVVHKVLEDAEGRMWISTNNGLARFDLAPGEFSIYTHNKGLVGNQFNYKSGIRASDGRLYFGSIQGFVGFDPLRQFSNRIAPPVVITGFNLFNKEIRPSDKNSPLDRSVIYTPEIELVNSQSTFSVEFAALSYDVSEMNRYAYRLEGLEKEWNYISGNQRASYSNVPYGRYVFRVKGANSDGLWNNEGASLPIRIKPPFWASAVGISLEVVLGLSLIGAVLMIYRKRTMQKHMRIIEKMRTTEEIALQKAKMSFFTNITHEIRTPLSLIKAPFEQIAKTKIDNADVVENLEIMGSNINRLLNLTNELLDFSKAEAQGFKLHLTVTDIGVLLKNTLAGFRQVFRDNKLDVALRFSENPVITCTDPEILVKIFTNLISNAAKFAAGSITIGLEENRPEPGFFRFFISNDGTTIDPANRENVFKAFFQEKKAGVPIGSGLGLPLVRQLAELLGGRIYIDPRITEETRFVVEIPALEKAAEKEPIPAETEYEPEPGCSGRVHIIIADDESAMRNFLHKQLSKRYRVTACANGEEVLEVLEKEPADLVITDLVMPGIDGFRLCSILKTRIDYSHIPIIALTAKTNLESKIEGLNLGVDAYIEKPFSIEHIYSRIENLLTKISRLREAFRNNPDIPAAGSIARNSVDEDFLKRINDIILEHIEDEEFSINHLAKKMNISRSNLYRKIKMISHMPPNEFIRLCRLKRAAELLNQNDYRINEICYLTGFNSPSYFTKCFQRQFGVSPKDYIRRHGGCPKANDAS